MALCRFSDYQCDLYIYESMFGIECHIAANRLINEPESPSLSLLLHDPAAFTRAHREYMAVLNTLERVSIDLPHAGESRTVGGWSELQEFVTELKEIGYQVPDWLINDIREEVREATAP